MSDLVSCSIVTYKNSKEQLGRAIQSVLGSDADVRLFVVDNSPDSRIQDLIDRNKVGYIHTTQNIGFGAAHNIVIHKAFEIGSEYHLVLNPDIFFEKGTIKKVLDFMNHHELVGNLMPKVLYPDGSLQYLCKLLPTPFDWIGRRFIPFKGTIDRRNYKFELKFTGYDKIMDVPYLSGCFMFLRTSVLRKVGFFDPNIFMYGEETDLCRRIITKGYRTVYFPEARIYHEFQKGSHKSLKLTSIGLKSAIYYFNKWGWLFDRERKQINLKALKKLGYYGK